MKEFTYPEVQIVKFEMVDVITVSGDWEGGEGENDTKWN